MRPESLQATLAMLPSNVRPSQTIATTVAPTPTPRESSHKTAQQAPDVDELPAISLQEAPSSDGDLVVQSLLGEGGMGRVVLASQRSLRRRVAIKTAHGAATSNPAIIHEGVITGMLEHPNIPPIHALSRDASGRAVLVMKNIEGASWSDVIADAEHPIRKQSPLYAKEAFIGHVEVLLQVCNALDFAHSRGVIHRDLKPENVMLGAFGEVYLIDWGIAHNERWSAEEDDVALGGTPVYMAPEMVACETPDARTDVYLVGATLHELLVGTAPHHSRSASEALTRAFESKPHTYEASVPADLAALCHRAMARERSDRPSTIREVAAALRAHLSHRASIALCDEALRRLDVLLAALGEKQVEHAAIAKLQHECRFGFEQSLRDWADNSAARAGLSRLCEALARYELSQNNPRGARALLPDIVGDHAALEAEIARGEALAELRLEADRKSAEHARQMNMRNAPLERTVLTALFLLPPLVPAVVLRGGRNTLAHQHWADLGLVVALLVLCSGALVLFRRRIFAHEINRRWVALVYSALLCVGLNRLSGAIFLPGMHVTHAGDCVLLIAMGCTAAMALWRGAMLSAALAPVGLVAIYLAPSHEAPIFHATVCGSIVLLMGLAYRRAKHEAKDS